jgi:ribonuclease P protein component
VSSASFVLFGLPNGCGHCRLGITVTKKTGGAIRRNRIKRVLRDIFRRKQADLMPAMDLVVNARPQIVDREMKALEEEFLRSFARLTRRTGR